MTTEPKKSARLAEKRKLREEAGTPVSEDDYYFTPLFSTKLSTTKTRSCSPSNSRGTPSPLAQRLLSPTFKQAKISNIKTTSSSLMLPGKPTALTRSNSPKHSRLFGIHEVGRERSKCDDTCTNSDGPVDFGAGQDYLDKLEFNGLAMIGNMDTTRVTPLTLIESGIRERHYQMKDTAPQTDINSSRIFLSNASGNFITYPKETDLAPKKFSLSSASKICGVHDCQSTRKYVCSKTKIPLCSLECYKKNLETPNTSHNDSRTITSV